MTIDQPPAFPTKRRNHNTKEMPIELRITYDEKMRKFIVVQRMEGDFRTSYQIMLSTFLRGDAPVFELIIDEKTIVPLSVRQYVVVYILIKQMFADARDFPGQSSLQGWVGKEVLCSEKANPFTPGKCMNTATIDIGQLAKHISRLRKKLERHNVSGTLIETRGRTYRVSTSPSNITLSPP